jgi:hypothetical protein
MAISTHHTKSHFYDRARIVLLSSLLSQISFSFKKERPDLFRVLKFVILDYLSICLSTFSIFHHRLSRLSTQYLCGHLNLYLNVLWNGLAVSFSYGKTRTLRVRNVQFVAQEFL